MIFTDLPVGAAVFLELVGHTSIHVLGEAAHRLMALKAIDRFGWSNTGIANRLRRHPGEVQRLTRFRQAIDEVPLFGIQVHTITISHLTDALGLCQTHGLLTNDALIVALMQANSWCNLASNDADFDRVPGITRYAPA